MGLLRAALWGTRYDLNGQTWTHDQYQSVMSLAIEQAVAGLVAQGLIESGVRLGRTDALEMFGLMQNIRKRNKVMDEAVVRLCQLMATEGIRILVFKGQSVGALYVDPSLRQSGDIDFYCFQEDWEKAVKLFKEKIGLELNNLSSRKDVSFTWDGVVYEMHKQMTIFCYPKHQSYWKKVVMPEIIAQPYSVKVNDYDVPTLAPTYNALFIFIHIFQHLIADGIALRQFCDWARVLTTQQNVSAQIDVERLGKHLKGLGLLKAYAGLGAMLTEKLGVGKETFPFKISDEDIERVPALWQNMQERGNFGHNIKYKTKNMMAHGLEHLWRMSKQAREFYHYAPAEAWWHIPSMFPWWGIKIKRLIYK